MALFGMMIAGKKLYKWPIASGVGGLSCERKEAGNQQEIDQVP